MALTNIQAVKLLVGDVPNSPFYPLFTNEEIEFFLEQQNNNIQAAARMAAVAASFQLSAWSTRERTGNIEVWNNLSAAYLKALDNLIKQPVNMIPNGLMPYAAGISWEDVNANNSNPDNVRPALTRIGLSDSVEFDVLTF